MSKKLSICVTHYKETPDIMRPLLDSIKLQQGINKGDIEVIIAQDGQDGRQHLSNFHTEDYGFDISVVQQEHKGVSAARNLALDNAQGEYITFCDADDMYLNNYGLHLIFSAIQENPDAIVSTFVEEQKDSEGNFKIIRHDKDITFIHGKAYKRQYLIDNNIRFNEELTIHEDGYFNTIAITCADTKRQIETPFYLWKWNDESTVRKDATDYVLKTYPHLMKQRIAICEELEKRGYINEFIDAVVKTFLDSYYDFNKPSYMTPENALLRKLGEQAFKKFFMRFKDTYNEAAIQRKAELAYVSRVNAYVNGLIMEQVTIKDWLMHIVHEVE